VPPYQWGRVTLHSNLDRPVKLAIGHARISPKDLEEKSEIQTRDKTPKGHASPQISPKEQFSFQEEDHSEERRRHIRVRVYSPRLRLQDLARRQGRTRTATQRFEVPKVPPCRIPVLGKRGLTRKLPSSDSHEPCQFRLSQSIRDRIELEKSFMIRTKTWSAREQYQVRDQVLKTRSLVRLNYSLDLRL
jgi:hypothetical protein